MSLSGLEIYRLLPKTNCRDCGFPTCLAFALSLAKKAVALDKCPHLNPSAKEILDASTQPPIKLITIGSGEKKTEIGNESVMFRHEEKFRNPAAVGFIIEDNLSNDTIKEYLKKIQALQFERIGQILAPDLIAIKQTGVAARFAETVKLVSGQVDTFGSAQTPPFRAGKDCAALSINPEQTTVLRPWCRRIDLGIVLMSQDTQGLREALTILPQKRPLIYAAGKETLNGLINLAKEFNASLTIKGDNLDEISQLTKEAAGLGFSDIVIDIRIKDKKRESLWEATQIRRQALKKSNRALGYPGIVVLDKSDPYNEIITAGDFIAKYAGIVLLNNPQAWAILPLLTLRQNIYTDPQKPLQIEPKIYSIGNTTAASPVLVTTNFSLTYYTVLGEVEASKMASYIMSIDTEGMSVLTAWAAEKFTPEKIAESMQKFGLSEKVKHHNLIIPGYVAVISGDLEEKSGWKIIVGPKEAAGIPAFLRNLS